MLRLAVVSFVCTILVVMVTALRDQLVARAASPAAAMRALTAGAPPVPAPTMAAVSVEASASGLGAPALGLLEMALLDPVPAPTDQEEVVTEPEPVLACTA